MDYLNLAESPLFWIAIIPLFIVTIIQSVLIFRKAKATGSELGITADKWKSVYRAAIATAIGPSLVACAGCLALIIALGGPMALQRMAVIGSAQFELANATTAAAAAGASITGKDMNMGIFTTMVWAMTILCMGWPIVSMLFADRIEVLQKKVSGGNMKAIGIFAIASCTGAYGYLSTSQVMDSPHVPTALVAWLIAFAVNIILSTMGKKKKIKWLNEWAFTISMFVGLILSLFIVNPPLA